MEEAAAVWGFQALHQPVVLLLLAAVCSQAIAFYLQALAGFLQTLVETAANAHYLAHAFHGQPQAAAGAYKLLKVPAWDLGHHIVYAGFKKGRGGFGYLVG